MVNSMNGIQRTFFHNINSELENIFFMLIIIYNFKIKSTFGKFLDFFYQKKGFKVG